MGQSLVKNLVHLTFSTKHRRPLIDCDVQDDLFAYLAGILKNWDSPALIVGGTSDHVHVLFSLSKNHALSKVIGQLKSSSSSWMKTRSERYSGFEWQKGYGAFSVSASNAEVVRRYIENQQEHHRTRTFQEEFREFLQRHGIEFDERYVWD